MGQNQKNYDSLWKKRASSGEKDHIHRHVSCCRMQQFSGPPVSWLKLSAAEF